MDRLFMRQGMNSKKLNKADMAFEILHEGIMEGKWKPGDRLYDDELAERFGTSRNSIREALSNLVKHRLVEKTHWKGYKVREPKWEEIEEAIEIRECLEMYVLQKLQALSAEKYNKLIEKLEKQLDNAEVLLNTDDRQYRKVDMLFHEILYSTISYGGLPGLLEVLHAVTDLQMQDHYRLYPEVSKMSHNQHREILAKLKVRDFEEVKRLMQDHIENYMDRAKLAYEAAINSRN